MNESTVKYTKPHKANSGIIKDYNKVSITLTEKHVGSVGVSSGGGLYLSLADTRELENLITALTSARDRLKENNAESINWGESIEVDLFLGIHRGNYSVHKTSKENN